LFGSFPFSRFCADSRIVVFLLRWHICCSISSNLGKKS
jgi:hypothetical protein